MSVTDLLPDFIEQSDEIANSTLLWVTPGLCVGVFIVYSYLQTHSYPAFGAGLYILMANRIIENGYMLPRFIPYYTGGGLPFAYPPFGFYFAAVLQDFFNISSLRVARVLPGIITVGYLIPAYFLAKELLNSSPKAGLATIILAVNPPILQWHLSAGGFVRASAFTFTIVGLLGSVHLFRDQNRHWLPLVIGTFSLTVLSHPQYTIFFVASATLLWFLFDRSLQGFVCGLLIGVSGILLTLSWWGLVIQHHGFDIFLAAAGAQGGIGANLSHIIAMFTVQSWSKALFFFWGTFSVLGCFYLITRRRLVLPAWFLLSALVLEKARFPFFVGTFVSAAFIIDSTRSIIHPFIQSKTNLRIGISSLTLFFIIMGILTGTLYVTSSVNTHAGSQSLPQFIDGDDVAAMQWVQQNAVSSAEFIVLGDAAEWFPQQAHRTILVGPWGVEWKGHDAYRKQVRRFRQISTCESSTCVTAKLQQANLHPEYIYVPKGEFTVRGMMHHQSVQTIKSFRTSSRYRTVFENDGAIIFAVIEKPEGRNREPQARAIQQRYQG